MKFSYTTIWSILSVLTLSVNANDNIYKPYDKKLSSDSIFEQFNDNNWDKRWITSNIEKDDQLTYIGQWDVDEAYILNGLKGDKGLIAKTDAALHAISYKLPKIFDNTNNTLVLQYEVKFQKPLECGGAYIKLLTSNDNNDFINEQFSDKSPYVIMFGPDKCGNDNKVHFIIKHLNEKTGEIEEHQVKIPPMARLVQTTTLYTLIIDQNEDFQIRINGDIVRSGNLLNNDDFDLLPPKEIINENEIKPEDWVEEKYIIDENDEKPIDWDENAPYLINDPSAIKPEDWDENEPEQIPDPNDLKPEDWDDEYDGIWEQKLIDNPNCENHGCGKWYIPKIKNPSYKGKWKPRMIDNPNYKGEWKPSLIPNPNYYTPSKKLSDLEKIGAIGFEIWTINADIMFNNIYLGHSIEEAEDIGNSTFLPKLSAEHSEAIASDPNVEKPNTFDSKYLTTPLVNDIYEYALDVIAKFLSDLTDYVLDVFAAPNETLIQRPGEAVFFSSIIIGTFVSVVGFWSLVIATIKAMINSYFEPEKTAYIGTTKKVETEKVEVIKEKKGSKDSKINVTEAKKR